MNEIEKMYENAKIAPKRCSECDNNNIDCGFGKGCYPPFTAGKQIELCKWLIKNYHRYVFDVIEADSFETDLAKFMNEEWQGLTEEEKQQIKDILE